MIEQKSKIETRIQTTFGRVVGIDESGCSNFCGPAIVAGVVLPKHGVPFPVDDCKKLTAVQLEKLYHQLIQAVTYDYEVISVTQCTKGLVKSEYDHIKKMCSRLKPDFVLLDYHSVPDKFHYPQWGVEGGDQRLWCVAAASVIAKYLHDEIMIGLDKQYPEFNWKSNKGSIGRQLFDLTVQHGFTPHHRKPWVYSMAQKMKVDPSTFTLYTKRKIL